MDNLTLMFIDGGPMGFYLPVILSLLAIDSGTNVKVPSYACFLLGISHRLQSGSTIFDFDGVKKPMGNILLSGWLQK
ncbi:F-box SKIP31-like protein [Gossypium australe]|uniref:F-box SKIP31-like protein n=1 Tax=Gossypium australe TaxID=47621 RepID=A0A5B6UT83_9ROSI|nr:F-box SKIP31-like protein [Gossypium australe]